MQTKKNYIAIVRDHSASMRPIKKAAARDYNDNIAALKEASSKEGQDTIVSTIKCGAYNNRGYGSTLVVRDVVNSNVQVLREIAERDYDADGGSTPLFDAVGEAIEILESVPDRDSPDVSFLVMVITDGQENSSKLYDGRSLSDRMRRLQGTDRWTFAFRVPRGKARHLGNLGVPLGNILEWEQTDVGFEQATVTTRSAIASYYTGRSLGQTASKSFYTDLHGIKPMDLKRACTDVQNEVEIWKVGDTTELVREFCEKRSRKPFLKGAAFYELVKTEIKVQDYKRVVIRDRSSGAVYAGDGARQMLGLPSTNTCRIVPGDHAAYDVFIQNTSVNRKLTPHTRLLYWPNAGVPYTEGVSAPWGR